MESNDVVELVFDYRVSSESCCDRLVLTVVGQEIGADSGEVDWTRVSEDLTTLGVDEDDDGVMEYRIEWSYEKDYSVSSGEDAAYLDNVVLQ